MEQLRLEREATSTKERGPNLLVRSIQALGSGITAAGERLSQHCEDSTSSSRSYQSFKIAK